MSTAAELIARAHVLLQKERAALRSCDSATVLEIADDKQRLFGELAVADGIKDPAIVPAMRELVAKLRHNGVLLAHARDCIRDVVNAVAKAPSMRLSVTG